jgi:hypothetical protein
VSKFAPRGEVENGPLIFSDASGSGKKQRIIFSDSQSVRLKEAYKFNPYLSKEGRQTLAESLDLSEENVAVRKNLIIFC